MAKRRQPPMYVHYTLCSVLLILGSLCTTIGVIGDFKDIGERSVAMSLGFFCLLGAYLFHLSAKCGTHPSRRRRK
jgi:hypothetical protein